VQMKVALATFKTIVAKGCVALVYFSGHGCGDKGGTLLAPVEGANRNLETNLEASRLLEKTKAAKKRIILLDCYIMNMCVVCCEIKIK